MSKRILLALVVCSVVTSVSAQIKKGAILLGGDLGFSLQNSKISINGNAGNNNNDTYINVSPVFGRAIKENLVAGFDLTYSYNKAETAYPVQKTHAYGVGVFLRKYKELGKGFYLFGQSRIGGTYNNVDNVYDQSQPVTEYKSKGYSAAINIYPGVCYSLNRKWQLETGFNNIANLSFNHLQTDNSGATTVSNSFGLSSSLSTLSGFVLGFRFLLN